jgi:hypothetical protein
MTCLFFIGGQKSLVLCHDLTEVILPEGSVVHFHTNGTVLKSEVMARKVWLSLGH